MFPKICIDKTLPQHATRAQRTIVTNGKVRAVNFPRTLWLNGSTLRVKFLEGSPDQHRITREQALWWTHDARANISFAFTEDNDADIRIAYDPNDGAWSYLGTDAKQIPLTEPTMNLGFLDGGTAAHEFGHAIGSGHEHANPDGGIQWNREVVLKELSLPPNSWTPEQVEYNVFQKYAVDQIRGTQFDPNSIMLYFFPSHWTLNGKGTKRNETLSAMDREFIASSAAYPNATTFLPTTLPILDLRGTPADIGAPGEEDMFHFKVKEAGIYTIETGGQTDIVMKLFGPDSSTAFVAEDDDSGVGRNAKITKALVPGNYYVQVRHYNTVNGKGSYSITVKL